MGWHVLLPDARQRGQTLVLFALFAPVLLAFMAIGLDSAQGFLERRDAQGAADLAALAGARLLHEGVTLTEQEAARVKARSIAAANGYPSAQVTVTTPHGGDPERILVTIDSDVHTFFMPVLDLLASGDHTTMDVDARAVAYGGYEAASGGEFAILALEGCPSAEKSVDFSGSNVDVIGRVHSNSDLYISGSNNEFDGPTTHTCGSGGKPSFHNGGGGNTFDPPAAAGTTEPDPIDLDRSDFTCDWTAPGSGMWDLSTNGAWWVGGSKSSKTLKAGTYCSGTGSSDGIKLSDSSIVIEDIVSGPGGVTMVAQAYIEISGSNFQLHPHEHGVLFVSYGTSDVAIKVSGSGGSWEGAIYAPNGTAEVSGSSSLAVAGGIAAKRVKLNGSGFTIDGSATEGGPGEQVIALVE
jgi:Flp pilus assembly protein TadG